jgi:drug/metabolite transporter, DME family
MTATDLTPSRRHGRWCIIAASVLWSLNGLFVPLLTRDTRLGLNSPGIEWIHIGFYRVFFAGLLLAPGLRRADITFRTPMLFTVACFAVMNWVFVKSITEGEVASAMFLQYTSPVWMYLACVYWLGEPPDRRSLVSVLVALAGIAIMVFGGWQNEQLGMIGLGLASGITYAGVLLGIRLLRSESSRWVTVANLMAAAAVLLPGLMFVRVPSWPQMAVLIIFGTVQLGFPYWLMARGLRSVSPQEAGTLTLIEPILSPLWAFLVVGQLPARETWIGGAFILAALLYRYAPSRRAK